MNCCNDHGKCTGGKGCPIADDLPIQMDGPEPPDDVNLSVTEMNGVALFVAALLAAGFLMGRVMA